MLQQQAVFLKIRSGWRQYSQNILNALRTQFVISHTCITRQTLDTSRKSVSHLVTVNLSKIALTHHTENLFIYLFIYLLTQVVFDSIGHFFQVFSNFLISISRSAKLRKTKKFMRISLKKDKKELLFNLKQKKS